MAIGIGTWQAALALAQPSVPTPNPLAPSASPLTSPLPLVDISGAGPASAIHGNPVAGAPKFAQTCVPCHGDHGANGIANPGSNDGTVPVLNPIDPGFLADSNGDPAIFAHDIDLFLQHGSRPAGPRPLISMPAFGDRHALSQRDIADIEAYVMELNGVFWPDRCPGISIDLSNPTAGSRVEPGKLLVQGRAFDSRAQQGSGIDHIDFFLGDRAAGGRFVGTATRRVISNTDPTSFQAMLSLPSSMLGGHDLVAYAYSSVGSQVGVLSVPIAVGEDPAKAGLSVGAPSQSTSCTP
jgi:mono/diheme cytochrome c family protein